MTYKKFTIHLILVVAFLTVVSGCAKKPVVEPKNEEVITTSTEEVVATTTEQVATTAKEIMTTTSKDIDISGWKTYRNEEYGFEMKYPKDWDYVDLAGEFYEGKEYPKMGTMFFDPKLTGADKTNEAIQLYDKGWFDIGNSLENSEVIDFEKNIINFEFLKRNYSFEKYDACEDMKLECLKLVKISSDSYCNSYYVVKVGRKYIVLSCYSHKTFAVDKEKIVNNMIGSLKLMESKIQSVKVFNSQKESGLTMPFSFTYPSDLEIGEEIDSGSISKVSFVNRDSICNDSNLGCIKIKKMDVVLRLAENYPNYIYKGSNYSTENIQGYILDRVASSINDNYKFSSGDLISFVARSGKYIFEIVYSYNNELEKKDFYNIVNSLNF